MKEERISDRKIKVYYEGEKQHVLLVKHDFYWKAYYTDGKVRIGQPYKYQLIDQASQMSEVMCAAHHKLTK